jgi:phthiocerol/phenolphthiocerol synthesis type-I polyketide synthase E
MDWVGESADEAAIAIIGLAGRFPGAPDIAAFRVMLEGGLSGIVPVDPAADRSGLAERPGYVAARGVLQDAQLFDAALFGIAPRDAALLDPQQRIFLQCCWTALEDAGYAPQGATCAQAGVFASASMATHWMAVADTVDFSGIGGVAAMEKDLLAGRIAYHLGCGGPAVGVQTACSSSLVAVHMAVQALIAGECDLALAGGVSISVPLLSGYLWQPGGIASPDGACRPFTAAGGGTVKGDGAGVVVLRRLADALAEGDTVRAVIRGSAVTNDGRHRAGFAAPGVAGQARAIRAALQVARVAPRDIGYIEGHGTATQVGDAIELRALAEVFGGDVSASDPPVLGGAKAHIGHLDAAAGIAGLIKAVLAVEHGTIPPALYKAPPHGDLAASGFVLAQAARAWPERRRRWAGVSSFGLGGTNAHVVIEAAQPMPPRPTPPGPHSLVLTAQTRGALERLAAATAAWLRARPDANLADIAHTLAVGRAPMAWRLQVDAQDAAGAADRLNAPLPLEPAAIAWPVPVRGRRVPLPTTPFEAVRHWLDVAPPGQAASPASERLQVAGWRSSPAPGVRPGARWLVCGMGRAAAMLAAKLGPQAAWVEHPRDAAALAATGFKPSQIVHATALGNAPFTLADLVAWMQALAPLRWFDTAPLLLACTNAVAVGGERRLRPDLAGLTAAPGTLMAEQFGLRCACIDLGATDDQAACLMAEADAIVPLVAWRHGRRWVRDWQAQPETPPAKLREGGVWLITGGTGGIGLLAARHLAQRARAQLLLTGRSLGNPEFAAAIAAITAAGGAVETMAADLAEPGVPARLVARALERFGALDGIVHAAGLGDGGMVLAMAPPALAAHMAVKPDSALALEAALAGRPLDHFVLFSSHSGAFGAFGQFAYATANAALAGVAEALVAAGRRETVAVHWDRWQGVGMAVRAEARHQMMAGSPLPGGLPPEEALALLDRVLSLPPGVPVVLATSRPVAALLAERTGFPGTPVEAPLAGKPAGTSQPRPPSLRPALPARTRTESTLVTLWETELGFAPIGIADDFVSVGGDSLNALRIAGAARQHHGLDLPIQLVLEASTIAAIAARLDRAGLPTDPAGFVEEML